ncbi:MAG TPA: thiamine pyrophosphate-dependent enzyme [Planctomycetaceae bacterium]|nr:thiamine pyrophosphate-dependent enzyme [Planctomycetaceae bacterium]
MPHDPLTLRASLEVLHAARTGADVIITGMGTAREWMALGETHPLDFVYVPSSMGQATSLGLGLALARPDRRVLVCNGDGSLLMNLGTLVTITAAAPPNLVVLLFDNSAYEVTGAQPTPGAAASRADGRDLDYVAIARACGFATVFSFSHAGDWRRDARCVLDAPGPTFALLRVPPVPGALGPRSPGPAPERAQAFAAALARNPAR